MNDSSLNLKKKSERVEVRLQSIMSLRERLKEVEHKGNDYNNNLQIHHHS